MVLLQGRIALITRRSLALASTLLLAVSSAICATPPAPSQPAPDATDIDLKTLPAGSYRDVVIRTCAVCHPIDIVVQKRRTQDEWDALIARMIDHGARATEAEQDQIFDYLVRHFGQPAAGSESPATSPPGK